MGICVRSNSPKSALKGVCLCFSPVLRQRTWKRLSVEQLRNDIVNAHLATEAEIEAYCALLDSPSFVARGFIVMTAWGRRSNG